MRGAFMDNIENFTLPLHISNENDYIKSVQEKANYYFSKINEFADCERFLTYQKDILDAINSAKQQLQEIVFIYDLLLHGRYTEAKEKMGYLLPNNLKSLLTPLNQSSAFCGNKLMNPNSLQIDKLYLFRGRIVEPYANLDAPEMAHVPLDHRKVVKSCRYSLSGIPCLYLSSNSYVVWKEMSCPDLNKLTISAFQLDDYLLSNQIIDLTIPIYFFYECLSRLSLDKSEDMNSFKYIISAIPAIPLIIACSVVCDDAGERNFKVEYLFPQLMMQFLGDNVFGIAYRTNRCDSGVLSANNLAIPILNFDKGKRFGNVMKNIAVGKSLNIGYFNEFLNNNSSLTVKNESACGPSSKRMHKMFSLSLCSAESTFNKDLIGYKTCLSYDSFIKYNDSVFYKFDEYLLFANELSLIKI